MSTSKQCKTCSVTKPDVEFGKNQGVCKDCIKHTKAENAAKKASPTKEDVKLDTTLLKTTAKLSAKLSAVDQDLVKKLKSLLLETDCKAQALEIVKFQNEFFTHIISKQ